MTSGWLGENYANHFKILSNLRPRQFQRLVQEEFGVTVTVDKCRNARKIVMNKLYGGVKDEYKRLRDYVEEMKAKNPGSFIHLVVDKGDEGEDMFQRLYVCFATVKQGFMARCRKIVSVDGCFLKGMAKGQLLVVVGRDSNNQMFPIAWAQVEVESYSSWSWFFQLLAENLNMGEGNGWVLISDQQKGLLGRVADVFPFVEQRCCARHIFCNWRKQHRGKEIGKMFWKCANATNLYELEDRLAEMKAVSKRAYEDILEVHPQFWCKTYFKEHTVCDIIDNNLCEAFNGAIVNSREKMIIDLFDDI